MAVVSPALYYKLNLSDPDVDRHRDVTSPTVLVNNSTDDVMNERAKSPIRRPWLDDATANSLERRHKKKRSQTSPRMCDAGWQTLPRNTKLHYVSPSQGSSEFSRGRSSSGASSPPRPSPSSSVSNINLALNNLLPQSNNSPDNFSPSSRYYSTSVSDRPGSPSNRSTSASSAYRSEELSFGKPRSYSSPVTYMDSGRLYFDMAGKTVVDASPAMNLHKEQLRLKEEQDLELTRKLLETMKELKEIAEVSRVIDEVDDEEWLLMFIGELEQHLRDLIKEDSARHKDQEDFTTRDILTELDVEMRDKSTMLKVAQDLIRYLKERSTYALHRRSRGRSFTGSKEEADESTFGTLGRLKALAAKKPKDPTSMNKWQRRLSGLASTLDKCLQRLESQTSEKMESVEWLSGGLKGKKDDVSERKLFKSALAEPETTLSKADNNKKPQKRSGFDDDKASRNFPRLSSTPHAPQAKARKSLDSALPNNAGCAPKDLRSISSRHVEKMRSKYNNEPSTKTENMDTRACGNRSTALEGKQDAKKSDSSVLQDERRKWQFNREPEAKPRQNEQDRGRSSEKKNVSDNNDASRSSPPLKSNHLSGYCRLPPASSQARERGGSLDRKTARKSWTTTWSVNLYPDDPDDLGDPGTESSKLVSSFCRLAKHNRSKSGSSATELGLPGSRPDDDGARKQLKSEFRLNVSGAKSPSSRVELTPLRPRSRTEPIASRTETDAVREEDIVIPRSCQTSRAQKNRETTGITPTVRPRTLQSSTSTEITRRPAGVASSVQCSIISNENVQKADKELERLKKRSALLQQGLTEAREERDDRDRRIAILDSRVQRLKKSMEQGRTEQGSVEEELGHLRRLLNQERRDSQLQISELEAKRKVLEHKMKIDEEKMKDLLEKIERFKNEKLSLLKRCDDLAQDKAQLEEKLHDATMNLMREKRHSRKLQQENLRLESELLQANDALEAAAHQTKQNTTDQEIVLQELIAEDFHIAVQLEEQCLENEIGDSDDDATIDVAAIANESFQRLQEENLELTRENEELRGRLTNEEDVSAATTDCFRQQIEYLSNEVSLQQQSADAQKQQYEAEIKRLLGSKELPAASTPAIAAQETEMSSSQHLLTYEQTITTTLYLENERLRQERDELLDKILQYEEAEGDKPATAEFGCQAEDTSYMRMRAFDFYAQEAQRDARRLMDRGRQLREESLRKSMVTQRLQVDFHKKIG